MSVKPIPDGYHTVTPYLIVKDAAGAIEFYKRAFGATELYRSPMPDGNGIHAKVRIAKSVVLISDERPVAPGGPGVSLHSPQTLGGTSTVFELYVDDADAAYQRAVSAGATPTLPISDTFWGDRYGWVTDPFGHIWAIMTAREEVSAEEVDARMAEYAARGGR